MKQTISEWFLEENKIKERTKTNCKILRIKNSYKNQCSLNLKRKRILRIKNSYKDQ